MAITEATRHRLHQRLDQALGTEEAATLMEHLPPVGWADVATKTDVAHLADRMDVKFEAVDHRFEAVDRRFDALASELRAEMATQGAELRVALSRALQRQAYWLVGVLLTFAGLLVAFGR